MMKRGDYEDDHLVDLYLQEVGKIPLLTEEEEKFLESILTDLRWRYVKATK